MVCFKDYFYCAVENAFATEKKSSVVSNLQSTSPIHHLSLSLLLLMSFICPFTDENQWVLKVRRDLLESNARVCIWSTGLCLWWLQTPPGSGRVSPAVTCWVWVSITKWRDGKCGLGGCDSSLLPRLWLWLWPLSLLCLQVGGWSSFHVGDA